MNIVYTKVEDNFVVFSLFDLHVFSSKDLFIISLTKRSLYLSKFCKIYGVVSVIQILRNRDQKSLMSNVKKAHYDYVQEVAISHCKPSASRLYHCHSA